jgi:hypothetical protein
LFIAVPPYGVFFYIGGKRGICKKKHGKGRLMEGGVGRSSKGTPGNRAALGHQETIFPGQIRIAHEPSIAPWAVKQNGFYADIVSDWGIGLTILSRYSSLSRSRCALIALSLDMLYWAPHEGQGCGELNLIFCSSTGKSAPHCGQCNFVVNLSITSPP